MNEPSLSRLFELAQSGDESAGNQIAEIFLPKALEIARQKMPVSPSPMLDHEDLAISAVRSLCRCVKEGKIQFQGDRMLQGLLRDIAVKKSAGYWRSEMAQKRTRKNVTLESEIQKGESSVNLAELAIEVNDTVILNEQSILLDANEAAAFKSVLHSLEQNIQGLFHNLFAELDEKPRVLLLLMLQQDLANKQLAERLDCSVATVERYRKSIKKKIEKRIEGSDEGSQ